MSLVDFLYLFPFLFFCSVIILSLPYMARKSRESYRESERRKEMFRQMDEEDHLERLNRLNDPDDDYSRWDHDKYLEKKEEEEEKHAPARPTGYRLEPGESWTNALP